MEEKKNEYFKKLKQCQCCVRYVWHGCLVRKSRAHKQHSISHIATVEQFSSRNAHAKKEEKANRIHSKLTRIILPQSEWVSEIAHTQRDTQQSNRSSC